MVPIQRVFEPIDQIYQHQGIVISNFMDFGSNALSVITDVANMLRDGKDEPADIVFFMGLLQDVGVLILNLGDEVILIYKEGDPDVEKILETPLRKLPELLTSEDSQVRLLATHRLEELNK